MEGDEVTRQQKLRREIYALGLIIDANSAALASKTMNDDDRAALQRQMATRISHLKLLQSGSNAFQMESPQRLD